MRYSQVLARDPLEKLQFEIAKRADQLAASSPLRTSLNLHCWTEAEREIFGVALAPPFLVPAAVTAVSADNGSAIEPQLAAAQ